MFEFRRVSKNFDQVMILNDMSFELSKGARVGICGANGSGKSTIINIATGFMPPSKGEVMLEGKQLSGLSAWEYAKAGIVRTFQAPRVAHSLVLGEQIATTKLHQERAWKMAKDSRLSAYFNSFADEVPLGLLRQFELVRCLAVQPKVLFLDEPSAGLSEDEVSDLIVIIKKWLSKAAALVIVEHRFDFMRQMADHVFEVCDGQRTDRQMEDLAYA